MTVEAEIDPVVSIGAKLKRDVKGERKRSCTTVSGISKYPITY